MTTREEVWLRAWCAVSNTEGVRQLSTATLWANTCLREFDKQFPSNFSQPSPNVMTTLPVNTSTNEPI